MVGYYLLHQRRIIVVTTVEAFRVVRYIQQYIEKLSSLSSRHPVSSKHSSKEIPKRMMHKQPLPEDSRTPST